MERLKSFAGYTFAVLALAAAALTPFLLFPVFTRGVEAMGIRRDPAYSGGDIARTIDRVTYKIEIYKPVHRIVPLQDMEPFVQVAMGPVQTLPAHISEELDLDGDGTPDIAVSYDVPADPKAPLKAQVKTLGPMVKPLDHLAKESFFAFIMRVEGKIVMRFPLA